MNLQPVDILLVEDSDEDAELTLRAFRKLRLANHIHRLRDGEEALEWLFAQTYVRSRRSSGERRSARFRWS